MKIYSFIKSGLELQPVEVEVSLMPGLPQFQFVGMADTQIKDSQLKIKAALKTHGFKVPKTEQVLVNLKPNHLKKSSRGLELAIACAYLWVSNQVPVPDDFNDQVFIYGELDLNGDIHIPDDFDHIIKHPDEVPILTGPSKQGRDYPLLTATNISELSRLKYVAPKGWDKEAQKPELPQMSVCKELADLLLVVATGEHRTLLAGPAGTGKTTAARILFHLLQRPNVSQFKQIQKIARIMGRNETWRPFVNPHHTTPPLSMIGGGAPPFPGEITRAHGGVLLLDELLEFKSEVREALREPIESKEITVSRRGQLQKYPADFLLVATSNLCPCGDYVPEHVVHCRFSLIRCKSYLEKLSGPLVDRFEVMGLSHKWKEVDDVSVEQMGEVLQRVRHFQQQQGRANQRASDWLLEDLERQMDHFTRENLMPTMGSSRRRRAALLKVARSIADLEMSKSIEGHHLEKAKDYTLFPFDSLKRAHS